MRYGIGIARKGGLRKEDVLNTMDRDTISEYFDNRRNR